MLVLRLYYGIIDNNTYTYTEISDKLDVTVSSISMIHRHALTWIRRLFERMDINTKYKDVVAFGNLNLSNKTNHMLILNNIFTIQQIEKLNKEELMKLDWIGSGSADEIIRAIKGENNSKESKQMVKMNKEELINILKYAYFMSRVVAPIHAHKVGLYHIDGSICDFYQSLVERIEADKQFDLNDLSDDSDDQFLAIMYNNHIVPDVGDRDITYYDFFVAVNKN